MLHNLTREQRELAMDPKKVQPMSNDSGLDHQQQIALKPNNGSNTTFLSKMGRNEYHSTITLTSDLAT